MDLLKLLERAGIELTKFKPKKVTHKKPAKPGKGPYNEPKANHTHKLGGKKVSHKKPAKPGEAPYKEPKSGKGPKHENKVKPFDGKGKSAPVKKYN